MSQSQTFTSTLSRPTFNPTSTKDPLFDIISASESFIKSTSPDNRGEVARQSYLLSERILAHIITSDTTASLNFEDILPSILDSAQIDRSQIDSADLNKFSRHLQSCSNQLLQDPKVISLQKRSGQIIHGRRITPEEFIAQHPESVRHQIATAQHSITEVETTSPPIQTSLYVSTISTTNPPPTSSTNERAVPPKQQNLSQFRQILQTFSKGFTPTEGGGASFNLGNLAKSFPKGGGGLSSIFGGLGKLGKLFGLGGTAEGTTAIASATTAGAAASGIWIPAVVIGLIILIFILATTLPGPTTIISSNISPVGGQGGAGGDYSEPYTGPLITLDINGKICWPATGWFGGYMPENHTSVSNNQSAIDIDNIPGTPIIAPLSGTIITSGWNNGYGNAVTLNVSISDSSGGERACVMYFGHMSQITLPPGTTTIEAGTQLGLMGSTGNSTGTHLHWGITCSGGKPDIRDLFPPPDRDVQFGGSTSTLCYVKNSAGGKRQ